MQTIDRAMQVIKVLAESETKKWFSITDLSKECDLPVSTMHRLLQSMIKHRLIQQDPNLKLYSIGYTWMEYGLQMYDSFDFVGLIRPEMEKLMHEVEESVYFSKPIGSEALILERIDCPQNPIRIYDQLGIRIPMHIGAANKVMLAHMHTDEALKIIDELVPKRKSSPSYKYLIPFDIKAMGKATGKKQEEPPPLQRQSSITPTN